MIRLIIDKVRLSSSLATLKTIPNILRPTRHFTNRNLATEIVNNSSAASAPKDVIVYRYENPKFFKFMNFFAISQFLFWGYLSHWTFYGLKDAKVSEEQSQKEDVSWWRKVNLGEDKYKYSVAILCLVVGYAVIFVGWTFTLKSVRYLIASKNGKDVSIVTYTPFGKNRIIDVPIRCISAQESRQTAKVYLPLKVKNMNFFYILDMKGEFKNTRIFDSVIGLKRKF